MLILELLVVTVVGHIGVGWCAGRGKVIDFFFPTFSRKHLDSANREGASIYLPDLRVKTLPLSLRGTIVTVERSFLTIDELSAVRPTPKISQTYFYCA